MLPRACTPPIVYVCWQIHRGLGWAWNKVRDSTDSQQLCEEHTCPTAHSLRAKYKIVPVSLRPIWTALVWNLWAIRGQKSLLVLLQVWCYVASKALPYFSLRIRFKLRLPAFKVHLTSCTTSGTQVLTTVSKNYLWKTVQLSEWKNMQKWSEMRKPRKLKEKHFERIDFPIFGLI